MRRLVGPTTSAGGRGTACGRRSGWGAGWPGGRGEGTELLDGISGRRFEVRYEPAQFGDVRDTGAATERARRDLRYEPATELKSGLEAQFKWAASLRPR